MQHSCQAFTRLGEPCGFPPRKGASFCLNHEPGARTTEAAAHARAARTRSAQDFYKADFTLDSHSAIQAVIDTVVRLVLAGRITEARANTVLRACAIASRNFDPVNIQRPQRVDWDDYDESRLQFLATVDDLLDGEPIDEWADNHLPLTPLPSDPTSPALGNTGPPAITCPRIARATYPNH